MSKNMLSDHQNEAELFIHTIANEIPRKSEQKLSEQRVLNLFEQIVANIDEDGDKRIKKTILKNINHYYTIFFEEINRNREETVVKDLKLILSKKSMKTSEISDLIEPNIDFKGLLSLFSHTDIIIKSESLLNNINRFITKTTIITNTSIRQLAECLINQSRTTTIAIEAAMDSLEMVGTISSLNKNSLISLLMKLQISSISEEVTIYRSCIVSFCIINLLYNNDRDIDISNISDSIIYTKIYSCLISDDFSYSCYLLGYMGYWMYHLFPSEAQLSNTLISVTSILSILIKLVQSNHRRILQRIKNKVDMMDTATAMICFLSIFLSLSNYNITSDKKDSNLSNISSISNLLIMDIITLATTVRGVEKIDILEILSIPNKGFTIGRDKNLLKIFEYIQNNPSYHRAVYDTLKDLIIATTTTTTNVIINSNSNGDSNQENNGMSENQKETKSTLKSHFEAINSGDDDDHKKNRENGEEEEEEDGLFIIDSYGDKNIFESFQNEERSRESLNDSSSQSGYELQSMEEEISHELLQKKKKEKTMTIKIAEMNSVSESTKSSSKRSKKSSKQSSSLPISST